MTHFKRGKTIPSAVLVRRMSLRKRFDAEHSVRSDWLKRSNVRCNQLDIFLLFWIVLSFFVGLDEFLESVLASLGHFSLVKLMTRLLGIR